MGPSHGNPQLLSFPMRSIKSLLPEQPPFVAAALAGRIAGWQALLRETLCLTDREAGMGGSDQKTAWRLVFEDIIDGPAAV